jgi:hypothetical protein
MNATSSTSIIALLDRGFSSVVSDQPFSHRRPAAIITFEKLPG